MFVVYNIMVAEPLPRKRAYVNNSRRFYPKFTDKNEKHKIVTFLIMKMRIMEELPSTEWLSLVSIKHIVFFSLY